MESYFESYESGDPLGPVRSEVARAERTREDLSVVVIRLAEGALGSRGSRRLGKRISSSIRLSDTACWYDERHVALVLPGTQAGGAESVLDRIRKERPVEDFHEEVRILDSHRPDEIIDFIQGYARREL